MLALDRLVLSLCVPRRKLSLEFLVAAPALLRPFRRLLDLASGDTHTNNRSSSPSCIPWTSAIGCNSEEIKHHTSERRERSLQT
jgi:hypothetical protein